MSKKDDLLNNLSRDCVTLKKIMGEAVRHVSVVHRSMGERIIRFANPEAGKDKRSFNDMTEDERQAYRDTVEGINRKVLDELGAELVQRGFGGMGISGTSLYNSMRLAVSYTEGQILEYISRGASLTKMIAAAALESETDREKALSTENIGNNNLESFRQLVEKIGEEGDGIKADSASGKKAADTKKENIEAIQIPEVPPEEKPEKKKSASKAPSQPATLAGLMSRTSDHLEDKFLGQLADLGILIGNDYEDLSLDEQDKVKKEFERLEPLLAVLAAHIRMIYENMEWAGAIDNVQWAELVTVMSRPGTPRA